MTTHIDTQSIELIKLLPGKAIRRVTGVRYPGVPGYSELRIECDPQLAFSCKLQIVDVDEDLEVCVPIVRYQETVDALVSPDCFEFNEFRIARVCRLQRRESTDWAVSETDGGYIGSQPREQLFAAVDDGDAPGMHVVDAGLAFEGDDGTCLQLYADSFPLVFQLRLIIGKSLVPLPTRVQIT